MDLQGQGVSQSKFSICFKNTIASTLYTQSNLHLLGMTNLTIRAFLCVQGVGIRESSDKQSLSTVKRVLELQLY